MTNDRDVSVALEVADDALRDKYGPDYADEIRRTIRSELEEVREERDEWHQKAVDWKSEAWMLRDQRDEFREVIVDVAEGLTYWRRTDFEKDVLRPLRDGDCEEYAALLDELRTARIEDRLSNALDQSGQPAGDGSDANSHGADADEVREGYDGSIAPLNWLRNYASVKASAAEGDPDRWVEQVYRLISHPTDPPDEGESHTDSAGREACNRCGHPLDIHGWEGCHRCGCDHDAWVGLAGGPRQPEDDETAHTYVCPNCGAADPHHQCNPTTVDDQPGEDGVGEVEDVLSDVESALDSLPQEALGRDPKGGYYYLDELRSKVRRVLDRLTDRPEDPDEEDAGG